MSMLLQPKQVLFTFSEKGRGLRFSLECPIEIPMKTAVAEYTSRIATAHKLPCFVVEDIEKELFQFVERETELYYDEVGEQPKNDQDSNRVASEWSKAFSEEVLEFATPEASYCDANFAEVYHTLIHSPALETLLNLEYKYSMDMKTVIENKDSDMQIMENRQQQEMEHAMKRIGTGAVSDDYVNQIAKNQFEQLQITGSKWASEMSVLQETQKREYRNWVMTVHADYQTSDSTPAYMQTIRSLSNPGDTGMNEDITAPRREESFTVHLGTQLKTTHNIRLVCVDVMELCKHKSSQYGNTIIPQPQRLQTAMSLYSNSICALILLVDNRLNSYTGIKREFSKVCEQSTDFHFPTLDQQFERVANSVDEGITWRHKQQNPGAADSDNHDLASIHSSGSAASFEREEKSLRMQPGDFYVTRHSNLSEVHAVFHLVCDDSVRSSVSDISSRHPVILGYRNILRTCFRFDIHTISLPLLINHEMVEEMTIPWCLKRAELVFKCVKGFMMELATWSAQESRTIQFIVPKGLSDETYSQISAMIPSIFRMSNPVIL